MKRFGRNLSVAILTVCGFMNSSPAALPTTSMENHDLSLSAGIALPSATSSIYQNPAGLVFTSRTTIAAHVQFPDETFRSPVTGGAVYGGDGKFGLGAGLNSNPVTGFFGLAVLSPELKTSIGFIGYRGFSEGGTTSFNLGIMAHPGDKFHIGFTSMDFMHSTREWGVGFAADIAPTLSLALDTAYSHDAADKWIQPGLLTRTQNACLAIAYGFAINSNAAVLSQVSNGVVLAASIRPSARLNFEMNYRKISDSYGYYAGLSIALN